MADPVLVAHKLCKRFGALDAARDVSLGLYPGEILALIGPNGAGKTTVLDQLSGAVKPDSGRIYLKGRDITTTATHHRAKLGLGRSFQVSSLLDDFSVRDNLAIAKQAHVDHSYRFWRPAHRNRRVYGSVDEVLGALGMGNEAHRSAGTLSHGARRRLEVAMVMAGAPSVLLLDEPMAGAGPEGSREIAALVASLKGEAAVLLVEHDMDIVFALSDRICVLVGGKVIAIGNPDEIRANAAVRAAYLGEPG